MQQNLKSQRLSTSSAPVPSFNSTPIIAQHSDSQRRVVTPPKVNSPKTKISIFSYAQSPLAQPQPQQYSPTSSMMTHSGTPPLVSVAASQVVSPLAQAGISVQPPAASAYHHHAQLSDQLVYDPAAQRFVAISSIVAAINQAKLRGKPPPSPLQKLLNLKTQQQQQYPILSKQLIDDDGTTRQTLSLPKSTGSSNVSSSATTIIDARERQPELDENFEVRI